MTAQPPAMRRPQSDGSEHSVPHAGTALAEVNKDAALAL